MNATVYPEMEKAKAKHTEWRRDIHRHPELGFDEHRTAKLVAEKLTSFGIEVFTGYGSTGVVGKLTAGTGNRAVGLRADLDALPMQEKNDFAHKSVHDGVFHGCGHDGHTVMLLAAAEYLAKSKSFDGTIYFIFQPAEEGLAGGAAMVKDGLFEDFEMESVYGMHNMPGIPEGHFAVCEGPMMAAASMFDITVQGKGGHAAIPQRNHDPIVAASAIVNALQSIISRNIDPMEPAVLSVTTINTAKSYNVIPDEATLGGCVRTLSSKADAKIEARMGEVVADVAKAYGCTGTLHYRRNYPVLVNTPEETQLCADVARAIAGADQVTDDMTPVMGSEDFAFMLQERPGCYIMIGNGAGPDRSSVHHPTYDFNDDILPLGATYWSRLAETLLPRK